ncbi:hypothetical protein [Kytococcus sedentarius]|uniref:hypothetical protein n=1 Tax=Kytococcus sedentarius TaxID=1276 RepID=UPI0035BBB5BD
MTTGAWTAPAVVAASAAPALAASAGYDLRFESLAGGIYEWHNPENTEYNRLSFGQTQWLNVGNEPSPATGVTLTYSYDRRLFGEVHAEDAPDLGSPSTTTDGDLVTIVWPITASYAPGEGSGASIRSTMQPDDGITEVRTDYHPTTKQLNTPGGDLDTGNNVIVSEVEHGEVQLWNGAIAATYDTVRVECSDGTVDMSYPSTLTVTSEGPNPIPADTAVFWYANGTYVDEDGVTTWGSYFETFQLESATLDGEPVTLSKQTNDEGLDSSWRLDQTIPAGSTMVLNLSATPLTPSTDPIPGGGQGGLASDPSESTEEDNRLNGPDPVRV